MLLIHGINTCHYTPLDVVCDMEVDPEDNKRFRKEGSQAAYQSCRDGFYFNLDNCNCDKVE